MRKITQDAVNAFMKHKNFRRGNMVVSHWRGQTEMYLHNNLIAEHYSDGRILISNAGWPTVTTKERLNAIPHVSIYQRNFQWYLNGEAWNGNWIEVYNSAKRKELIQ